MGARSISPPSEMKLNIEKRSAEVGNASPLVNMEQEPISSTTPRAPLSSRSPEGLSISRNIRTSSTQRNGVACEGILFCGVPSSGICSISPNREARSGETRRLEICALARRALTAGKLGVRGNWGSGLNGANLSSVWDVSLGFWRGGFFLGCGPWICEVL